MILDKLNASPIVMKEPIAIIGSACRLPGAGQSPSELWELLRKPKDVLTEFSAERMNLSRFYNDSAEYHGGTNVPNKSYLLDENIRHFDASFFGITPAEAEGMDPQQRLLLETTYEALEAAGYSLERISNSPTSVFIGVMTSDYREIQNRDLDTAGRWIATGTASSILSNRISYCFNLKGPSMTIDTACSSSLVALHQAVQSLRNSESRAAIVGGVNLLLDPLVYISESKLNMLSPTSRCRMWDKDANGYGRGEGCVTLILKTMSSALTDGDDIECIIRETAVNSDGRSPGITMPNHAAQESLIKQTYRNCGLDPVKDRCQYFECHGTGTPAGDPAEAEAIQQAFFPKNITFSPDDKLYVGSIKTIIGHSEGCAGLAGILKVMMCIKNRTITPNLLFEKLNPDILPFYDHLEVATRSIPWPHVGADCPLRASVNSFGFGGTNAHAIIESSIPLVKNGRGDGFDEMPDKMTAVSSPLVFSAHTRFSLLSSVERMACYIRSDPTLSLDNLAWVLGTKRTSLPLKISFAGASRNDLLDTLDKAVSAGKSDPNNLFGTVSQRPQAEKRRILGIFTGQGAQWATMGRELIKYSDIVRKSIDRCERSLADLQDGPSWSLVNELTADEASSRLNEAELSQPLTTAIEIAVYDLVKSTGVDFDAFVGHSSGEIAAAYAVGVVSAEDAMKIAYYRGVHAKPPRNQSAKKLGGMMAAGMSYDAGVAFCAMPQFAGRIVVAASNAPHAVTLSGDIDAIHEAKAICDQKKTFARVLRVDVAYHSHHMRACAEAYLKSLEDCNIQVSSPRKDCCWISSVKGYCNLLSGDLSDMQAQYWVNNMVQPVLFSQAIRTSSEKIGPFSMVIEMGPHAALKAPVVETLKALSRMEIPYISILKRNWHDVKAASSAIGFVWEHLGPTYVDLGRYCQEFVPSPKIVKNLPTYPWDHSREYWRESRISRKYRLHELASHPLLGRLLSDGFEGEKRWRNILISDEIPWLRECQFENQILIPPVCYMSLAFNTAVLAAPKRPFSLVEIHDIDFPSRIVLQDSDPGLECLTSLKINQQENDSSETKYEADFSCCMCFGPATEQRTCTARIIIHFGNPSKDELPQRSTRPYNPVSVDVDTLFEVFASNGVDYSGMYKALTSMNRGLNHASVSACWTRDKVSSILLHPAILETLVQSLLGAFASPFSRAWQSAYFPDRIGRLCINPNIRAQPSSEMVQYAIDACVTSSTAGQIEGDVSMFDEDGICLIQAEGLLLKSVKEVNPDNDRLLFSQVVWNSDPSIGEVRVGETDEVTEEKSMLESVERTALYYLRQAVHKIDRRELPNLTLQNRQSYDEIRRVIQTVKSQQHPILRPEWLDDTEASIKGTIDEFPNQTELRFLRKVGDSLLEALRGEVDYLDIRQQRDCEWQDRFCTEGNFFAPMRRSICSVVKQVVHKYPHIDLFEFGAEPGMATETILDAIGGLYRSYCCTDISQDRIERKAEKIVAAASKIQFRVVDMQRNVADQGCKIGTYDLVLATSPVRATGDLNLVLLNARSLLKPGGYLIAMDITGRTMSSLLCVMSTLGWWSGRHEASQDFPVASPAKWDALLRSAGFSGTDYIAHQPPDADTHYLSVMVSQAVDNSMVMLREPMASMAQRPKIPRILILGGGTLLVSRLIHKVRNLLSMSATSIKIVEDIDDLDMRLLGQGTCIISAIELDGPHFCENFTLKRLHTVQELFRKAETVLWLTAERFSNQPYNNMVVGIGRAMRAEHPGINLQFLDVSVVETLNPSTVVEVFLRLAWTNLRSEKMLWIDEPELRFDGQTLLVPRLVWDAKRNARLNAHQHHVMQEVPLDGRVVSVELKSTSNKTLVALASNLHDSSPAAGSTRFITALSIPLFPLILPKNFLWLGTTSDKRCTAIGISDYNASTIDARLADVFLIPDQHKVTPTVIKAIASYIIAYLVAEHLPSSGSVLLYDPHKSFRAPTATSRRHVYVVTRKRSQTEANWISIHPRAPRRVVEQTLPKNVSCYIDLGSASSDPLGATLRGLFNGVQFKGIQLRQRLEARSELISQCYKKAISCNTDNGCFYSGCISVQKMVGLPATAHAYPTIVDWSTPAPLSIPKRPRDQDSLFSPSKSYLMVGMAYPIGFSILSWMARNGARTFILTGNIPQVHEFWLQEMTSLGAVVVVMEMDISDKESVSSVYTRINQNLPPIAGVCNAAMSLSDKILDDDSLDDLDVAWGSKVQGTVHLDAIFSQPTLDFFILFSSLGALTATPGRSANHAASLFMSGLVQQRRQRGLAASIIRLGMVVDIGFFATQKPSLIRDMASLGKAPLSEADIHQAFAEAVNGSDFTISSESSEIIIGLEPSEFHLTNQNQPQRSPNPLLSHFIEIRPEKQEQLQAQPSNLTFQQRLAQSNSKEQLSQIILQEFSKKVETVLQLSPETLNINIVLLDLGFDSLLIVGLKVWFAEQMSAEISALGMLQNTSLELCSQAASQIWERAATQQVTNRSEKPISRSQSLCSDSQSSSDCDSSLPLDSTSSNSSDISTPSEMKTAHPPTLHKFERLGQMSPYQSLIWFAGNYMKDPSQYNVVITYKVKGNFLFSRFELALTQVVSRHESLRTAFFADPITGDLQQGVLRKPLPFFSHIKSNDPSVVSQEFDNAARYEWRLEEGETFQVIVVSLESGEHTVIFSYHHIIMDGVSWSIFLRELKCYYEMNALPANISQYIDYSSMQNLAIQGGAFNQVLDYWGRELSILPDLMPLLPFAKVKIRSLTDNYNAHTTTKEINKELADGVRKASQGLRGTAFHFYLAALQILLAKILNIERMCIGMSDANRKDERFINTVGYFVNVLPLQFQVRQEDTFSEVFQSTSRKVLAALSNSSVPSSVIIDHFKIPRDPTHTPLFQVAINYRVGEITKMSVADFALEYDRSAMGNAPYDMSFHITPTAIGTCILEVTCRDYLYSRQAAEFILNQYIDLIEVFVSNVSLPVLSCPVSVSYNDESRLSIRHGPRINHGWPSTIPERFQEMVDMHGQKISIKHGAQEYSYAQLNRVSNCIANALLKSGIKPHSSIAVLCGPSLHAVACMIAVLRIGCVYVPLDLSLPPARHIAMIEASRASVVLCSSSTSVLASGLGVTLIINTSEVVDCDTAIENKSSGTQASILLYTSGSTGKPKGVRLPQVGLLNYLAAKADELSLGGDFVLQQSSLGFDMGIAQILNAIMNGGKLIIVPQEIRGDPVEIAKIIRNEQVTFTLATPSEYILILQSGREYLKDYTLWRNACLGGEPFTDRLKQEFILLGQNSPIIQDSYGVTEISACTTFETMSVSQLEGSRSVGKALPNTSIYIVDEHSNLVDIGLPGEICIGGIGIAIGYLDPQQTQAKFVKNRFATDQDVTNGWTQMYRTGDKGRLLEDGSLLLMGRMDGNTEIKLRGLRIDLEDVASTLINSAPDLLSSGVVCVKREGECDLLVAYVSLVPGRKSTDAELQRLANSLPLPQYMHPALVIQLDTLPRNSNGKIDRKAIQALPLTNSKMQRQSSRRLTLDEGELKLLWEATLPNKPIIHPESDFFMLGGNSLLLVKLQSAIRTSIGVRVTIRELYASGTLDKMAVKIRSKKAETIRTTIDWTDEIAVPESFLETQVSTRPRGPNCEVLLTGSESFLGSNILQVLVDNPIISRINCVAVEKEQEAVLLTIEKVNVYIGNLPDPTLGLSSTDYDDLLSRVDVIIHAAANGHCLNTYSSLRTPNLTSTHFLAQFALRVRVPLHYVSSGRVILLSGESALDPVSVSSYPPPSDGAEGLTATKWASEAFLEQLSEQFSTVIHIHRPCTAIGDNAPHHDALNSLLRYANILGATPRLSNMGGYFDFQQADIIAKELVTEVVSSFVSTKQDSKSPVSFHHYSSKDKVSIKSFKDYMENVHNRPFEELDLSEWASRALDMGIEPLITTFLEAVAESSDVMYFPYLGGREMAP